MIRRLALAALAALAGGCATPAVYPNGIKHCYLCAVRVARVNGYEVREQDFHPNSGELIAARSVPDLRETEIKRSWFRRQGEVWTNLWDRGRFEAWDADVASERVRTEERMRVGFSARATGPLGWLGVTRKDRTKVKFRADHTEYGREDWVITRRNLEPAVHERLRSQMRECLTLATPTAYTRAAARPEAPTAVAAGPAPAAESPSATPPVESAVATAVSPAPGVVPTSGAVAAAPSPGAPGGVPVVPAATSASPVSAASAPPLAAGPAASATAPSSPVVPAAPPVRLTKLSPDRIAALLKSGKDAYEGGKFKEAIPPLEQAAAADPESAEALVYLGAAYYQEKRLDDAIRAYEAYILLAPDDLRSKSFLDELRREKHGGP